MKVELDRHDLKALVKGSIPEFKDFNNPLIMKAGHLYSDQYGQTCWNNLGELTDDELWEVYIICKNKY